LFFKHVHLELCKPFSLFCRRTSNTSSSCTALPLENKAGTSVTCDSQADADARIAAVRSVKLSFENYLFTWSSNRLVLPAPEATTLAETEMLLPGAEMPILATAKPATETTIMLLQGMPLETMVTPRHH